MRIGVISDTHIPEAAIDLPKELSAVLKTVDLIVHAGDLTDIAVVDRLKKLCPNVKAVWGNMDSDESHRSLPEKIIFQAGTFSIGVMHGYGHPKNLVALMNEQFKNDKVDVIIFGHSHEPLNVTKGGILFFNPGSCTDKVYSTFNSYGIIEVTDKIKAQIVQL